MATFPDDELSRTMRDEPPTHFTLKIESFSLLSNSSLERYDSSNFEAGGYKWKLCVYPNGNKHRNGEGHISLYLEMSKTDSLSPGWEVHATFRLLLLDQLRDKYLLLQDAGGIPRRFRATNTQSGFDKFITLKEFNDPTKGYLVSDTCMFGAEVFVQRESVTGKGECLLLIAEPLTCHYTWKIEKFSKLDEGYHLSEVFNDGFNNWNIKFYPNGCDEEKGKSLSLFLCLDDSTVIPSRGVYLEAQVRVVDQTNGQHVEDEFQGWFDDSNKSWGWRDFLPLSIFLDQSNGYLVKDVCIIEAQFLLLGEIEKLPQNHKKKRFC
ncbi:hypothetical protein NE237_033264 [Protea cynaroides]|uniref:MATH domain-containing protein n=1 Tax=Protea cynaroides TaxID=273540 RepID=A0A9Q0L4Y5_9MAGN|nr:hypothetical protein NE237_033264 [Protea cynaroides]